MAQRMDAVPCLDKKKQLRTNWKRVSITIIYGSLIACVIAILTNNPILVAKFKPKPEEKLVKANYSVDLSDISTQDCEFASIQGRRKYQEDRVTCNLDLSIPFFKPDDGGLDVVGVGVVAVFDGHIGSAASDMASKLFLEKFILKSYAEQSSNYREFLNSSLVQTIEEIDAEFSKVALEHELYSGSTAVVAVIYNNSHVLVANVGDSKAFICSGSSAKELTRDHNAYRLEERARVEASGGVFTHSYNNNVPDLLMGHFPMTRAIGDVSLKKYGIIATPEVTDWLHLTSEDEYLVVASDGIFESLSPQKVCDFINQAEDNSDTSLLAQQLVQKAFLEGSSDNLSVVLVQLGVERVSPVVDYF
ncbi:putative protein phosphatase 2C 76 [Nicotiana tabacum]|uniref:Probable protein phosphatase 2C 51 n=1 Tax=Nicotiana tabacum TaxID=4097 RepID=A0A1S4C315_TOBAC|nr:probable protein phosphatase 2C 51 [Nicotiana tomentosiformis]XP_016495566.1 PREDICTED: probable protein phosphatase 2C 51 [Nicotiana tabacum]